MFVRMRIASIVAAFALPGMILALSGVGCVPIFRDDVEGPQGATDLRVEASAEAASVFSGAQVELSATATGGTGPYVFRWDFNGGPEEIEIVEPKEATITTVPLDEPGRYNFRVTVTDADGFHAEDFFAVTVSAAVTAEVPPLAIIGEATPLSAEVQVEGEGATLLWEVMQGQAEFADPTAADTSITTSLPETVKIRLTVTLSADDEGPAVSTSEFEIVSIDDLTPRVVVATSMGDFTVELDGEAAPLHAANMLLYADEGFFDGLLIHRAVCQPGAMGGECEPFVIQGGGYRRVGDDLVLKSPTREPVPAEVPNGLSNSTLYSVALALSGGDPDSGNTQFFVNLDADNDFLDEQDFTVFGLVVAGTDVVDAIVRVDTTENPVVPNEDSLPVEDVVIESIRREPDEN